jgi:hypothetical protein
MPRGSTLLTLATHHHGIARSEENMRTALRTIALSACAACLVPSAHAVENGAPITPFGVFDFGAGQLPPPSDIGTVGVRFASYRAHELRDDRGERSPVGADLGVDSAGVAFIKMTGIELGSAKFGWGAVLPYLRMSLDLTVPTPVGPLALTGSNNAQGDIQLIPVILQWTPSPGVYTNFQLVTQIPTGSYDKTRLINAGTNHWTVSPTVAATWILPSGLELSTSAQINFNGRNKDTDYRSGTEYQQEFALGQHMGPWTFGVGGYFYQQIGDDSAPGLAAGNRGRVRALGPALSFFDLGSGWPLVWIHAYKEFGARNRAEGRQVTLRAAWTF